MSKYFYLSWEISFHLCTMQTAFSHTKAVVFAFQLCQLKIMFSMRKILAISKTRPQDTDPDPCCPEWETPFTAIYRSLNLKSLLSHSYTHMQTVGRGNVFAIHVAVRWYGDSLALSLAASRCKTRIMLFYWKWMKHRGCSVKNKQVKVREICTPYRF